MVKKKITNSQLKKELMKLRSIADKERKRQKELKEAQDEKKKLERDIKMLKQSKFQKVISSKNINKRLKQVSESRFTQFAKKRGKIILRNLERLN